MKFGVTYSRSSMVLYIILAIVLIGFIIWWFIQYSQKRNLDMEHFNQVDQNRINIMNAFEEYLETIYANISQNKAVGTDNAKKATCMIVISEYYMLESLLSCYKDFFKTGNQYDLLSKGNISNKVTAIDGAIVGLECNIAEIDSKITDVSPVTNIRTIKRNLFTTLFRTYSTIPCVSTSSGSQGGIGGIIFSAKIVDTQTTKCLTVDNNTVKLGDNNANCITWNKNSLGQLSFNRDNTTQCLTASSDGGTVVTIAPCNNTNPNQKWIDENGKLKLQNQNKYLSVDTTGARLVTNSQQATVWRSATA